MEKNSEYSYLAGKIIGDGNLEKTGTIRLISSSKKDLENISKWINNTFNLSKNWVKVRRKQSSYSETFVLQVNNSKFGKGLISKGIPFGNKTQRSFSVPSFVFKNTLSKKRFLQAILEDELTTIKIEKKNYSVKPQFKMAKIEDHLSNLREFLNQIRKLMIEFEIECSYVSKNPKFLSIQKSGDKTYTFYFAIQRNKRNIIKFKENIGFRFNSNKIKKLDNCYKILKDTLKPIINKNKIIELRRKEHTIRKIASLTGVSRAHVHRIVTSQNL